MTTTHRIREKSTGQTYWVEHRIGFHGHEYNAGGGWRTSMRAAFDAARKSDSLTVTATTAC